MRSRWTQLRAGEATSAALLVAATRLGLATTPLSQAMQIAATRHDIRTRVLQVPDHPQLILRIGWPASQATDIANTDRRDLRFVLLHACLNRPRHRARTVARSKVPADRCLRPLLARADHGTVVRMRGTRGLC